MEIARKVCGIHRVSNKGLLPRCQQEICMFWDEGEKTCVIKRGLDSLHLMYKYGVDLVK